MNENIINSNDNQFDYETVTKNIRVQVQPTYLEEQSEPEKNQFVWAYRVRISNEGNNTVQLIDRHWEIIDGKGKKMLVDGEGVIGQQPVLEPKQAFEYISGTPLNTPSGIMSGFYRMLCDKSEVLQVKIPAFSLESPHTNHVKH